VIYRLDAGRPRHRRTCSEGADHQACRSGVAMPLRERHDPPTSSRYSPQAFWRTSRANSRVRRELDDRPKLPSVGDRILLRSA
jgi:hypothetical protein